MSEQKVKPEVKPGDVIQVKPDETLVFGSNFFVVTEVRHWGILAETPAMNNQGGIIPIRLSWGQFEPTGGKVVWWYEELEAKEKSDE